MYHICNWRLTFFRFDIPKLLIIQLQFIGESCHFQLWTLNSITFWQEKSVISYWFSAFMLSRIWGKSYTNPQRFSCFFHCSKFSFTEAKVVLTKKKSLNWSYSIIIVDVLTIIIEHPSLPSYGILTIKRLVIPSLEEKNDWFIITS